MKINVTIEKNTLREIISAGASTANEFGGHIIDENRWNRRVSSKRHSVRGPGYGIEYTTISNNGHESNLAAFDINIDEDAMLMAVKYLMDVSRVMAPFINGIVSIIKGFGSIKTLLKSHANEFTKNFNEKFGRPSEYAVTTVVSRDLNVLTAVIVEDDGFGNREIVHAVHYKEVVGNDLLMKLFESECRRIDESLASWDGWRDEKLRKYIPIFRYSERSDADAAMDELENVMHEVIKDEFAAVIQAQYNTDDNQISSDDGDVDCKNDQ